MSEDHNIPSIPRFIDLTGMKFGNLSVVSYAGEYRWNCRYKSGDTKNFYLYFLMVKEFMRRQSAQSIIENV